jgi:hypothetical protein
MAPGLEAIGDQPVELVMIFAARCQRSAHGAPMIGGHARGYSQNLKLS